MSTLEKQIDMARSHLNDMKSRLDRLTGGDVPVDADVVANLQTNIAKTQTRYEGLMERYNAMAEGARSGPESGPQSAAPVLPGGPSVTAPQKQTLQAAALAEFQKRHGRPPNRHDEGDVEEAKAIGRELAAAMVSR